MYDFVTGLLRSVPNFWFMVPFVNFFTWLCLMAINGIGIVWTFDWTSIDASGIIPEAKVKPKTTDSGDGSDLIEA